MNRRQMTSALGLALIIASGAALPQDPAVGPVERIEADGRVMYRYRDEGGAVVVQDRPPLGYYEQLETRPTRRGQTGAVPVSVVTPAPGGAARAYSALAAFAPVVFLAAAGFVLAAPLVRRRFAETPLQRALRRAGFPVFTDMVLEHGATVDYAARTPAGILLIVAADIQGEVAGGATDPRWVVTTGAMSHEIDNPLHDAANAARHVGELVGDVPVHSRVVLSGRPRFVNARPAGVYDVASLRRHLPHFAAREGASQRLLDGAWRVLMRFPRGNAEQTRVFGAGWKAWLWRRRRFVTAGVLAALAASSAIAVAVT